MVEQAFLPVPQGQTGMSDLPKNVGAIHELPLQKVKHPLISKPTLPVSLMNGSVGVGLLTRVEGNLGLQK